MKLEKDALCRCYSASSRKPDGLSAREWVPPESNYSFVGVSPHVKLPFPAVHSNEVKNEPSVRACLAGWESPIFITLQNANVIFFNMRVLQRKAVVAC